MFSTDSVENLGRDSCWSRLRNCFGACKDTGCDKQHSVALPSRVRKLYSRRENMNLPWDMFIERIFARTRYVSKEHVVAFSATLTDGWMNVPFLSTE